MNKKIMLALCILLLAALVCAACLITQRPEAPIENAGLAQNAAVEQVVLTYQGTDYPLKPDLQTVLLIGTDSEEAYDQEENRYSISQADFLMLLVLDKDTNTAEILHLNRDTMTDVPWLDVMGKYGGTAFQQLCLAYNYGDGGPKSCKNTVKAVTNLLFDAPVEHYIQIPMSAIPAVNDLMGGVPVTMPEDLTALDPAFAEGATVRLNGDQAEKFIRARMALADDTNLARMGRQQLYMDSFQAEARAAFDSDSNFALRVVETLAEYMQSDLTAQQLTDLVVWLDSADIHPIQTPAGQLTPGEKYYEYHVEEASLWELVRMAYCE